MEPKLPKEPVLKLLVLELPAVALVPAVVVAVAPLLAVADLLAAFVAVLLVNCGARGSDLANVAFPDAIISPEK